MGTLLVKTPGFYNAGGGNGCTNVPVSDAFGLIVTHNANGEYYTQIFFLVDKNTSYRRYCNGGTWSGWTQDKYTDTNTWRGIQNNLTSDSTSDSLSAAQGKALKGLIDGKAPNEHTHQYLSLYGARPANINFTKSTNGTGAMFHFVATSSTTTGKPPDDSSILQLNWDNSGGWDSQLALSTTAKPHVYYRNQQNGTWSNWSTLLDNLNYTDYAAKKEHTHSKSQITDFPASLKNPTALTIQTNGTTAATYDGSAAKTVNVTKGNIGLGNVDNTADKNKSVASAAKLTTARTVSGGSDITLSFNYDGSGNSTANIGFYSCKHNVDNTNNYPFHRFARLDVNKDAWVDKSITFLISQDYSGGGYGICRLVYRSNVDSGSASVDAQWLVRRGFSADTIQVAIKTDKTNGAYCDAFYKSSGTYMGVVIRAIASGGRATSGRTWTLVDSNEVGGTTATDKKTSSECWKTIADAGTALHKQAYSASAPAKDEGYVASAGSANTSSSCTGNSASATKLTSSAGSAAQPVYFKDGKPVAGTYTLGDASSKTVRTLGAVGNTGWANKTTDDKYIPTMSFMAYWNGAYSGTSSNLQYCDRGRFGTIVTKGSGDYAVAGHTHNYAGSGSAGGSANSAVKLDSNAGSSVQPVYFSGGKPVAIGYTISSSVPANAKFTDTTYGVASSSSNGLMSSTDKTKLDDFSRVISIQKQIKLTTDWLDTGIAGNSLDTGTYVVQVSGFNSSYTQLYSEIYSGVMSWYSGTTNSGNSSEIFLHNAGLADNNNAIYLRTLRVAGSKTLKLQIACKVAATGTDILTFKFRRLI
ncbi:MAG: pyocin knob domain-containing protein [Faecalibacterium prausnitzii]